MKEGIRGINRGPQLYKHERRRANDIHKNDRDGLFDRVYLRPGYQGHFSPFFADQRIPGPHTDLGTVPNVLANASVGVNQYYQGDDENGHTIPVTSK